MRPDSPRWKEIHTSAFPHERAGLRHLRDLLPDADPYAAWANVEFVAGDGSINEVDLLVLTPGGLYLLELKHWQGAVSGDGFRWRRTLPGGKTRWVDNPLLLTNRKAKRLRSLLTLYAGQQGRKVNVPFVKAAVFLHGLGMASHLDSIGQQHVYGPHSPHRSGLPDIYDLLTGTPASASIDRKAGREIVQLINSAGLRPSFADRTVGGVLLHPKPYAEGTGWQDFLGTTQADQVRRVRFYLASKATSADRDVIQRAAEREFRVLQGIYHSGIAHAVDLVDHELGPAVLFEHDDAAVRLDQWLVEHGGRLTAEDRLELARQLANIVRYAHSRRLVHRNLNPRSILVRRPESPRPQFVVIDWQTGWRGRGSSQGRSTPGNGTQPPPTDHLDQLADEAARVFQAPEVGSPQAPGVLLDVFSLGALTYLIFTGEPPAASVAELHALLSDRGGLDLGGALDAAPVCLTNLVYEATFGVASSRVQSADDFLKKIDEVWEELTAPDPAPSLDPFDARPGDELDGGLVLLRHLGEGASSIALLVREAGNPDAKPSVLKIARDRDKPHRLRDEADRLRHLKHQLVAQPLTDQPICEIGGYTALRLEFAGEPTLAVQIATGGRLNLELLERYGKDLFDILAFLDGQGVSHRDIKPANLAARPRPKDGEHHLCIFDFSLAAVPADRIEAGTPPYLDPFLGPPRRRRFDPAAERFGAAVTLFEMATGSLPRWGDGISLPSQVRDEVTLALEMFDPAAADRLIAYFRKALARDARQRFDTVEEMADAWRAIFKDLPKPDQVVPAALRLDAPLELAGLTARARSALERFGVHTVGELLDHDSMALSRVAGVSNATKTEIRRRVRELRLLLAIPERATTSAESSTDQGAATAHGIEALVDSLLAGASGRGKSRPALRLLLGVDPPPEETSPLRWPSHAEVARHVDLTGPRIDQIVAKAVQHWQEDAAVTAVADEIVTLLDAAGGVMSAVELAQELIAARGSFTDEPRRTSQAIGVVRAAVEVETARGGESRVDIKRLSGGGVLVGRESDDPAVASVAVELIEYALSLGRVARRLANNDPLPTPTRAVERLREVPRPSSAPPLSDDRLLRLAAAATRDVAVNAQRQLYPVGLPAARAIQLAAGSLAVPRGRSLTVADVHRRVRARFPHAGALPDRTELDRLLTDAGVALRWSDDRYAIPTAGSSDAFATAARYSSSGWPVIAAGQGASEDTDMRLVATHERFGFLAVMVKPGRLRDARRELIGRLGLRELDVTRILIEQLRALGVPWQLVLESDARAPTHPDRRSLNNAVRHAVVPHLAELLAAPEPMLLTEAAPLARYGCMDFLSALADSAAPRPAARFLLVPSSGRPMLDDQPIPVTSAAQMLWLPEGWLGVTVAGKDNQ